MFGSWICKEDPDGGNHSCSLRVESECLWECGVEGWQGAARGLGGWGSKEWEAAIPTHPACVDLELISLTQDAWVSAEAGL